MCTNRACCLPASQELKLTSCETSSFSILKIIKIVFLKQTAKVFFLIFTALFYQGKEPLENGTGKFSFFASVDLLLERNNGLLLITHQFFLGKRE